MSGLPGPARAPIGNWEQVVDVCYHSIFNDFLSSEEFRACTAFRDQIWYIYAHSDGIPQHQVALFFNVNTQSVRNQLAYLTLTPKATGRPSVINDEVSALILEFIQARNNDNNPPTVNDVLNLMYETFHLDVLPDTLRKWINRETNYRTASAQPIEEARLQVTTEAIVAYFEELSAAVDGMPPDLVINLDESGFQKFADARHNVVIVPKGTDSAHYPVGRNEARSTFLAAVSASGNRLKPLVIIQRKTIEAELFMAGYTDDQVAIVHSENGYISAQIFNQYLAYIVIPYIQATKEARSYEGDAVLIMDGCSCHCTAESAALLDEAGVKVILLPSHSSDQTQPCDLGLFGNMKSAQSRVHAPKTASVQSQQIMRMVSAYHMTCHPLAVTSAFRRAGISLVMKHGRTECLVTRWTAGSVRNQPDGWNVASTNLVDMGRERITLGDGLWGMQGSSITPPAGMQVPDRRARDRQVSNNQLAQNMERLGQTLATIQRNVQALMTPPVQTHPFGPQIWYRPMAMPQPIFRGS